MVALTLDKLAVFYRQQDRRAESEAAMVRANVVRALFYATGLSEEALVRLDRGEKTEAERLYRQAVAALDSARPEHQELFWQVEKNLKELAPAVPKAAPAAPARKSSPKTARKPIEQ